ASALFFLFAPGQAKLLLRSDTEARPPRETESAPTLPQSAKPRKTSNQTMPLREAAARVRRMPPRASREWNSQVLAARRSNASRSALPQEEAGNWQDSRPERARSFSMESRIAKEARLPPSRPQIPTEVVARR